MSETKQKKCISVSAIAFVQQNDLKKNLLLLVLLTVRHKNTHYNLTECNNTTY